MKKNSELSTTIDSIELSDGASLRSLSEEKPVLLVFLRHFGCIFCQEALRDISDQRTEIEKRGSAIAFVHMEVDSVAEKYFARYNLADCLHISDPECRLYEQFGLLKGTFSQLFGLSTMVRGFQAGMSLKQFGGAAFGDAFQMPGIFVIYRGQVEAEFVHEKISDRPDYLGLLECCTVE